MRRRSSLRPWPAGRWRNRLPSVIMVLTLVTVASVGAAVWAADPPDPAVPIEDATGSGPASSPPGPADAPAVSEPAAQPSEPGPADQPALSEPAAQPSAPALSEQPPSPLPADEASPDKHEPQAMAASPAQLPEATGGAAPPPESCGDTETEPLPSPGTPGSQGFWSTFREPMPPAPVWNPPGPKRVGLQAGHWRSNEVPREQSRLVGGGTSGGGKAEWEVNLDIAQRAAAILESYGVQVDLLPATVPPGYRAHAFISIHADGDLTGALRGYKIARAGFSPIPETDDVLVEALYAAYGQATGLSRDDAHLSRRMLYYYAFNSRRYCHAIAPGVPR